MKSYESLVVKIDFKREDFQNSLVKSMQYY